MRWWQDWAELSCKALFRNAHQSAAHRPALCPCVLQSQEQDALWRAGATDPQVEGTPAGASSGENDDNGDASDIEMEDVVEGMDPLLDPSQSQPTAPTAGGHTFCLLLEVLNGLRESCSWFRLVFVVL